MKFYFTFSTNKIIILTVMFIALSISLLLGGSIVFPLSNTILLPRKLLFYQIGDLEEERKILGWSEQSQL